jgi:hypothetical protein
MPDPALLRQVEGFSLTTAEILYRLPDYPRLLQSFIWQDYDSRRTSRSSSISWISGLPILMDRSIGCASLIGG